MARLTFLHRGHHAEAEIDFQRIWGRFRLIIGLSHPQDLRELARIPHPIEELRVDETIGTPPCVEHDTGSDVDAASSDRNRSLRITYPTAFHPSSMSSSVRFRSSG